jgi:hypothetical protein
MDTPASFSVLFSSLKSISTFLVKLAIMPSEMVPEWLPNVSAYEGLAPWPISEALTRLCSRSTMSHG